MPYNPAPINYGDPKFKAYKEALKALGPIDSDEKADEYGRLFDECHNLTTTSN